jgi:hypothetical protein
MSSLNISPNVLWRSDFIIGMRKTLTMLDAIGKVDVWSDETNRRVDASYLATA